MTPTPITVALGAAFGLALAAPPGPMNAVIAGESVVRGWTAGFRAGLGAMSADALFFVLALFGAVSFVERFPAVRAAMVGAGGLLMLYFAAGAAADARGAFGGAGGEGADDPTFTVDDADGAGDAADETASSAGFRKAFALALTNPYQIIFWLTVGVGLLEPGRVDVLGRTPYVGDALAGLLVVDTGTPALVAGFFGGILLWIVGFPAALTVAERRVDAFAPVVAGASALVLVGFGLLFLSDAARTLL